MNSIERCMAALCGEKYDVVPVVPLIIQHAMEVSGIPHGRYSTDADAMAEAQLCALRLYGYDGFHISSDNYVVAEALGNRLSFPHDEPPRKDYILLRDHPDLSRVRRGFDPLSAGRMGVLIEAVKKAREAVGKEKFIKANCDSGPFSVAASLRGEENLFLDLYDDPQYVTDLMQITAEAIIRYAKELARAGAHAITYGESTASLMNREQFQKYVLPMNRYVVGEIRKTGLPVFYHMCGNVDHIVDLMRETGADCLELDSLTDLEDAYEKTGRAVCVEGTVDTVHTLLNGTPEDVYAECAECIRISGGRNLILSSGCELPRHTPEKNVRAMLRAARDHPYAL